MARRRTSRPNVRNVSLRAEPRQPASTVQAAIRQSQRRRLLLDAGEASFPRKFTELFGLGGDAVFTRASNATAVDYQGILRTMPDNCARRPGGRFFRNTLGAESGVFGYNTDDGWSVDNWSDVGSVSSTLLSATETEVTLSATPADRKQLRCYGWVAGLQGVFSIEIKCTSASSISVRLKMQEEGGSYPSSSRDVTVTDQYQRFTVRHSLEGAATQGLISIESLGTAGTIVVKNAMLEQSTGATDPTLPNDYVSVGVATGSEEWSNNPDSYGTGWSEVSAGVYACDGTQTGNTFLNELDVLIADSAEYVFSFTVSDYSAGALTISSATPLESFTANGDYTTKVVIGNTNISFKGDASFEGTISNISVKRADPGLVGADGCAWFLNTNPCVVADGVQNSTEIGDDTAVLTGSGWTDNGDGSYTHTGTTQGEIRIANGDLVDGTEYVVECRWVSGGALSQIQAGGPGGEAASGFSRGFIREILTANGTSTANCIRIFSSAEGCVVDRISVKEYVPADDTGIVTTVGTQALSSIPTRMEPAADNLLTHSQDLTDADWVVTAADTQITANQAIAPDGTATAEKVADTAVVNVPRNFFQNAGNSSNSSHTASIFAKNGDRRYAWVQATGQSGASLTRHTAVFDLETGLLVDTYQVNSPTSIDEKIEPAGNGYFRISATCDHDGSSAVYAIYGLSDSATPSYDATTGYPRYTGDGSFIYFWQADLVASSVLSSPIKTESTTASRAVDELYYPMTTPQSEGMAIASIVMSYPSTKSQSANKGILSFQDGGGLDVLWKRTTAGSFRSYDGTTNATINGTWSVGDNVIVAAQWGSGSFSVGLSVNGGAWAWSATEIYDGAWPSDDVLTLAAALVDAYDFKYVEVFDENLGQAYIEANY